MNSYPALLSFYHKLPLVGQPRRGCIQKRLDVKHNFFKQFMTKALAFVTASPEEDSREDTAQQRQKNALVQFSLAIAYVSIAVWVAPPLGVIGIGILVVAVAYSIPFVIKGVKLLKSANKAAKGTKQERSPSRTAKDTQRENSVRAATKSPQRENSASQTAKRTKGEEAVALILRDLQQQGWKIEYNLQIPKRGAVDVFLRSPKNNYFIIDVKHERGEVFFDEGVLKRREWSKIYDFEEDFLQKLMEKALSVKNMKRLRIVTPILCFTDATISIETVNNKARDVYVVKKESLVRKLVRLDDA